MSTRGTLIVRHLFPVAVLCLLTNVCWAGGHDQSSFEKESFTEDDFAQFFSLVKDGKIAAADISERCQTQGIGFTFVGTDITHDQDRQRIFYNVSKEDSSADGRTLRLFSDYGLLERNVDRPPAYRWHGA